MDTGIIGKLEKAKRYAEEKERFNFESFAVTMEGENGLHKVQYDAGNWTCDCGFFQSRGRCSHTMSLEIILEKMLG
ncbi:MAG: SWIM zinc finger family protein [Anaerolineaceae bacterium]|nr:SWIM zinc finger family protein [Anaerolineaceae bacterium]